MALEETSISLIPLKEESTRKVFKARKYFPQHWGIPPGRELKEAHFTLKMVGPSGDKGTSFLFN